MVPDIIGKRSVESCIKTVPIYSFSRQENRQKDSKSFISKEHTKHLIPEDVPGVGQYNPNKLGLIQKLPNIAFERANRFASVSKLMAFKQNM